MPIRWFARTQHNFRTWWCAPITGKDRAWGAVCGAIAFFWIALILLALLHVREISALALAAYVVGMMIAGTVLGERFPKAMCAFGYPFLTMG